jgi:hypothetical protein
LTIPIAIYQEFVMAARRSQDNFPIGPIFIVLGVVVGIPFLIFMACGVGWFFTAIMARRAAVVGIAEEVADMPPPRIVMEQPAAGPNPLVPKALPQPPAPAGVAGKKMIDLIPLINPQLDSVHGRWAVAKNVLHCNDAHFVPRIQIPYQPPREYDFIVVFSQPALRNGISMVMPNPANGNSFFWFLGNDDGSGYGFQANPDVGGQIPGLVKANTICTTTVQVRANSVEGFVNGKQLVNHPTNFADLTCDNWRELRDKSLLAVACDDPTVFHHVRLIEITGQGKKMR